MTRATPLVFALNGSPAGGGSVARLLDAVGEGAREAGAEFLALRCAELHVRDCIACGPDATTGWCIFHDDMDRVYDAIERAHAIVVGAPVWFDGLPAPLKRIVDRCNCMTPLVTLPEGGMDMVPKLARTRRGLFVVAGSAEHPYEPAERSVRGWMKWVGAKWEETIAWRHNDYGHGSVDEALLERARASGRRLAEAPPLEP